MDTTWLELLSNIDKMVLGSIVGSVVLAFVLVVIIFSVKIKSQHDRITLLQKELDEAHGAIDEQAIHLRELERRVSDGTTIVEHYQGIEAHLTEEMLAIQDERDQALKRIESLHDKAAHLQQEKTTSRTQQADAQAKLLKAQEEVEAVLKRNEFWVEQLSELRTKHDALKHKLRSLEKGRS